MQKSDRKRFIVAREGGTIVFVNEKTKDDFIKAYPDKPSYALKDGKTITEQVEAAINKASLKNAFVLNQLQRKIEELSDDKIINSETITFEAKIKHLHRKYYLIIFILFILNQVPDVIQNAEWYQEKLAPIAHFLFSKNRVGYINAMSAIIREEANPRSNELATVLYSEKVIILGDVPYWFQVQYTDEHGNEIYGWIAKLNVDEKWEST